MFFDIECTTLSFCYNLIRETTHNPQPLFVSTVTVDQDSDTFTF